MTRRGRSRLVLTGLQTNCLVVLRNGDGSQAKTAIEAKLDIRRPALRKLAELGLASYLIWIERAAPRPSQPSRTASGRMVGRRGKSCPARL
jgi:hypothetical protein